MGSEKGRAGDNMKNYFTVMTCGFSDLPAEIAGDILAKGLVLIKPDEPTMVAFDPKREKNALEDGGRTLIVAYPELEEKVYVKLDDYGSKEFLSENVGQQLNTQYAVTFMLAVEY